MGQVASGLGVEDIQEANKPCHDTRRVVWSLCKQQRGFQQEHLPLVVNPRPEQLWRPLESAAAAPLLLSALSLLVIALRLQGLAHYQDFCLLLV